MATVYSGASWTGSYTYTRVKVDYSYPSTTATATLLYTRTNTYSGETSASGATFWFGNGSAGFSKSFWGQTTDAVVTSCTFTVNLAGGTYSGSSNGQYLGGSWSVSLPAHTYAISYSLNGGTSGTTTAQTKTHGTNLTLHGAPSKSNTTGNGYTVSFNANGGNSPSKSSVTATNTYSYSFGGWKSSATGTTWGAGASFSENNATTLSAQWNTTTSRGAVTTATCSKNNGTSTRTVTFNANGGSCSTSSSNSTATITYTMNGWYTATSGGTKRCGSGGSYTPSATETLYAQWGSSTGTYSAVTLPSATKSSTAATARVVTFNANGGSCSTASSNSNATITYSLKGWYTATSGGTSRGTAGQTYTPSGSETIYAQWDSTTGSYSAVTLPSATKANTTATRKVTFNATSNGGNCSTSSLDSSATVTYSHTGWFTAASGGTSRGAAGASYTPSATETVYAQFSGTTGTYSAVTLPAATKASSTTYRTVNFDSNGGICLTTSLQSSSTLSYTQTGWFTQASGGEKRGNAGASYTPSSEETLYAQFSGTTGDFTAVTLPAVARDGYKFKGWALDKDATLGFTTTYTPAADGEVLYAIWEEVGNDITKNNVFLKMNGVWKPVSQIACITSGASAENLTTELGDYENALNTQENTIDTIAKALQGKAINGINPDEYMSGFFNDTIETFSNDYITYTHSYCICNKANLKKIKLGGLTTLSGYAISSCSALHTIDFEKLTKMNGVSLNGLTALHTFIIRTPSVCSLANASSFARTKIEEGTGYIYVPDNLIDSYKSATNWSTYANQIKGLSELGG